MKLYIASDHAGFDLKAALTQKFQNTLPNSQPNSQSGEKIEWIDLGPASAESTDYPLYAQKLCEKVLSVFKDDERLRPCAVLVCGSGVGVSMAANRYRGIRAVLADRVDIARLSREHNASNVLCLGSRIVSEAEAFAILTEWLKTEFAGDRHLRRVNQMDIKKGDS